MSGLTEEDGPADGLSLEVEVDRSGSEVTTG